MFRVDTQAAGRGDEAGPFGDDPDRINGFAGDSGTLHAEVGQTERIHRAGQIQQLDAIVGNDADRPDRDFGGLLLVASHLGHGQFLV